MTVALTNTTRRMKIFVLPHEIYCEALGRCACATTEGLKPRRMPTSLTLPAGSVTAGLEDVVLLVPEIAKAARASELLVRREFPMTAVETANPVAKAASAKKRKSERGEA